MLLVWFGGSKSIMDVLIIIGVVSLAKMRIQLMAHVPYMCMCLLRRALLTDMYLRVKGAEGVFAIGDCSTIEHDLMIKVRNGWMQSIAGDQDVVVSWNHCVHSHDEEIHVLKAYA